MADLLPGPPLGASNRRDRKWAGIGLYVLCLIFIVLISMIVKSTSERISVEQLLLFRFGLAVVVLLIIGLITRQPIVLKTRRVKDHAIRSLSGVAGIGLFFVAVAHIPLATATVLAYSSPIFCVVLSIPLLGEKIGVRRWTAVLVGFIGVLIISWSDIGWSTGDNGAFEIINLAAIGSAIGGALVVIYLRKLGDTEHALTTALFYNAFGAVVFGIWTAITGWNDIIDSDIWLLMALGILAGTQQFSLGTAFRFAEATLLAPLEYMVLVFAAIAGYVFWKEIPSQSTWIGGGIIICAGLFLLHRKKVKEI